MLVKVIAGSGSNLNGIKIEFLLQQWWSWLLSIPDPVNPSNDPTGYASHIGQPVDTYFWLAGAHRDKPYKTMITVNRSCTIPAGRSIAVALAANECCEAEFPHVRDLMECARKGDSLEYISARWNGKDLVDLLGGKDLRDIGVECRFEINLPQDNIFGAPPGRTEIAAHGYMVVVTEIDPGEHTFQFTQITAPHPDSRTEPSGYQVNYKLYIPETV